LRDVQDEEALFQSKKRRKALREAAMQEVVASGDDGQKEQTKGPHEEHQVESLGGVKFY
jgi:hypothetical protein